MSETETELVFLSRTTGDSERIRTQLVVCSGQSLYSRVNKIVNPVSTRFEGTTEIAMPFINADYLTGK